MSNIAVVLWLPRADYLNSCRLLGKAIHKTHLPPSDQKYSELAAHSHRGTLDGTLSHQEISLPMAGGWNEMVFKFPSHPNHSMIL